MSSAGREICSKQASMLNVDWSKRRNETPLKPNRYYLTVLQHGRLYILSVFILYSGSVSPYVHMNFKLKGDTETHLRAFPQWADWPHGAMTQHLTCPRRTEESYWFCARMWLNAARTNTREDCVRVNAPRVTCVRVNAPRVMLWNSYTLRRGADLLHVDAEEFGICCLMF